MSTTLTFCVRGQRITRADSLTLVADSLNYVYAEFVFCSDWDGLVKTAVFTRGQDSYEQILDENDKCLIPYEVLQTGDGVFRVSVFAGNLITTAPVRVRVDASGWSFALESSEPPTPGIYQQILDRMAGIESDMETATEEAKESATLAESWAVGGTNTRQGEDSDNAKYYAEQAANSVESAEQIVQDFEDDVQGVISDVESAGTAQVGLVTAEGTRQVGLVSAEGTAQVGNVNTEGSTQVAAVQAEGAEQVAAVEGKGQEVLASIPSDYTALSEDVSDLKEDFILQMDEIPDTVQSYAFADGTVSQISHMRSGTAIRTDVFTYGENTITEARTLNTGESLTIVTNLTTLETTVTYSVA